MSANAAHFDDNQVPTIMGAIGTLGTADTGGTASPLPFAVDALSGAAYTKQINGTVTSLPDPLGSVVVTVGTMTNTGTNVNVVTGTLLNTGTVINVATGTQQLLTTVSNLTNGSINILTGTLQSSGTTTGVGVVSNLTNGSVVVTIGSIVGPNASGGTSTTAPVQIGGTTATGTVYGMLVDTAGNPQIDVVTIPQVSVGTLPTLNLTTGTITTGSLTNIAQIHNAGTLAAGANNIGDVDIATGTVTLLSTVTTLSNLTNGSVNILTGTVQNSGTTTGVGVVSNLTNGSINVLTGTVTSVSNLAGGTVQINSLPVTIGTSYGTLGTTGADVWGTLIAASGAGTYQYVSGLSIVVASGTVDCAITNIGIGGTTGAGVLARGRFPAGGGIARDFSPVMRSGANGTLSFWLGGAGTAFFSVNYWQAT